MELIVERPVSHVIGIDLLLLDVHVINTVLSIYKLQDVS